MEDQHDEGRGVHEHRVRHDRRYMMFAIGLALVVLAFAAISITVVVSTTP